MTSKDLIETVCTVVGTLLALMAGVWVLLKPWLREQLGLTHTIKEQVTNNHEKNFRDEVTEVHDDLKMLIGTVQGLSVGQAGTNARLEALAAEFGGRVGRLEGRVDGLYSPAQVHLR